MKILPLRTITLAILTFSIIIFLIGISNGVNNYSSSRVDKSIYEQIKNNEQVKVVITFNENITNNQKTISDSLEATKNEIKNTLGNKNLRQDFRDKISAEISPETLKQLENDARIKKIEPLGYKHILLSDSVGLVNASRTWSLQTNSINLTGAGQTICIIDTGINYSHLDLGGCYGNNNPSSSCKVIGGYDYCADDTNCASSDADPKDVQGHGTHVSGITSANGTIRGVAPDARIVMIKACNSTGSCPDDAIKAGIDWCVNNASIFNISVISMSLGGGLYNSYCDGLDDSTGIYISINSAAAKNISVAVSSGNDGSTSTISSPACIQNATPVGSIDKDDLTISSFSNTWNNPSLTMVVAPGRDIVSTSISGTSTSMSGTSMSAPHVAGVIAIINQYLRLTSQTKTSNQIEAILNNTGKQVYDSSSNRNFSRVNLYNSIIILDNQAPNVSLISPPNNSVSININQTFRCNASDISLKNVTFYLWNSSSIYNQTLQTLSSTFNRFEINISNITSGNYKWNCLYTDETNNKAFAPANYSLTITSISVNLTSPLNGTYTNQNQSFVCNATSTSASFSNVTFYLWNSSSLENTTSRNITGLNNNTSFSYNFTRPGNYIWNCLFTDNLSSQSFALTNNTLVYDLSPPSLTLLSPLNNSWYNAGKFNISLSEPGTCQYSLNRGIINYTMTSFTPNTLFNATNNTLLQDAIYNVTFYCNDSSGNKNSSSLIFFKIDMIKPNINLTDPYPSDETSSSATKIFYYNVSDNINLTNCALILNNAINNINSSAITNLTNNISAVLTPNTYTWQINCTDEAENIGNSSSSSFTISAPAAPTGSSGGGGGGGSGGGAPKSVVYHLSAIELQNGYSKELKKDDKLDFTLQSAANENNSININSVLENKINITFFNYPINLELNLGETKKINLTSPEYYTLLIRLNNIFNKTANITIQEINEKILQNPKTLVALIAHNRSMSQNTQTNNISSHEPSENPEYFYYLLAPALILVLIFIVFLVHRLIKNEPGKEDESVKNKKSRKKE